MVTAFRKFFIRRYSEMPMQIKILKDVVASIAGQGAIGVVDLLFGKKNVNEFIIAKKLKMNINQTRNILYKLADHGLVSFSGKKDKKSGGWYTYYWTLDTGKSLVSLRNRLVEDIKNLEKQLENRKSETYYHCKNCDIETNNEQALLNNFTCPECGEVLTLQDASLILSSTEKEISKNREYLTVVEKELAEIDRKKDASRARRFKAEEKKRKKERAARMKARMRERNREKEKKKKTMKKKPKNKAGKRKRR